MKENKLEEIIKDCGYKMPTKEFIETYKIHEPTKQKIYYYLRKNKLPTYREYKKEQDQYEREIFNEAKRKIAEIRNKKGEIWVSPFEEVFTPKTKIKSSIKFSIWNLIITFFEISKLGIFFEGQEIRGLNEQDL